MTVFQQVYQGYSGEITPSHYRPLVIFRYAMADIFESRLFIAFFTTCFILPLALMSAIYMRYNLDVLAQFQIPLGELMSIDVQFFASWMQMPQMFLLIIMIMSIGPTLISPDLGNNALPLYLSRPISKASYISGKLLVLLVLGSIISWVPGVLLIFFNGYFAESGWLLNNLHLPAAAIISSLIWILSLSMMSLAVSAWVKWKAIARLFFFGLVFVGTGLGAVILKINGGWGGSVFRIFDCMEVLVTTLYGIHIWQEMPVWAAGSVFAFITVVSAGLLARRIRAFEVL